ncbi:hypothetical protein DH2020_043692 [Rehmannia glutinosa]|uniref:Uncharacterized protein n=1 Tax=Rehmannia glutinosa TaxID=99300 RepID=A0ABR0UKS8_REHGL
MDIVVGTINDSYFHFISSIWDIERNNFIPKTFKRTVKKMWRQTAEFNMDEVCQCGRRVVKKTSWTDLNPGRRAQQIIPGLLKKMNRLDDDLKRVAKLEDELKKLEDELKQNKSREKWL